MGVPQIDDLTPSQFMRIAQAVRLASGINLTDEKMPLVNSRLVKRIRKLKLPDFEAYCNLITSDAGQAEHAEMLSAMTTNVTSFFREKHHFDELKNDILPKLLKRASEGGSIRIWSAGCSSGEEPYSIAMTIAELCGLSRIGTMDIRILATDLDPYVLEKARKAVYPRASLNAGEKSALQCVDDAADDGESAFRVKDELRSIVKINRLNLMKDWPMRRPFDAIFCRNVMIYFDADTQERLVSRFADNLSQGGMLFLGHSERVSASQMTRFHRGALTSYKRV